MDSIDKMDPVDSVDKIEKENPILHLSNPSTLPSTLKSQISSLNPLYNLISGSVSDFRVISLGWAVYSRPFLSSPPALTRVWSFS